MFPYESRVSLLYNPKYKIIICVICQFAVDPMSPYGHVKQRHGGSKSKADIVGKFRKQFTLLPPDKVPIPAPRQPTIPHILLSSTAIDGVLGRNSILHYLLEQFCAASGSILHRQPTRKHTKGWACRKTWCLFL